MKLMTKPNSQPERLWNLVKDDAPELSQLALRLMGITVNAAGCERAFSQMGVAHTKLRNRLGWAKTTQIAQLRQELHRDRPARKKAPVVAGADAGPSASTREAGDAEADSSAPTRQTAESQLLDADVFTSAAEFDLTVNEWIAGIDAEERQAAGFDMTAYKDCTATLKAPLGSIFAGALPMLDDESFSAY